MKIIIISLSLIALCSCGSGNSEKANTVPGSVSPADSLVIEKTLGPVIERYYEGVLPAADGPGIRYDLTLWNQEFSGTGVFSLDMTYLEAVGGKDTTFNSEGRWYTLRGDAENADATVFQLVPFGTTDQPVNFLMHDDSLTMLNGEFERAASGLNYTLTRVYK